MSWLLGLGAIAQVAAFLFIHGSSRQILAVSIVVAAVLLVAHEVLIERTLGQGLRLLVATVRRRQPARSRA
jgi:hypothetical protein